MANREEQKSPRRMQGRVLTIPLISQIPAGVGTGQRIRSRHWLPGVVGPCPSATLDKSVPYSIVGNFTMGTSDCQRIPRVVRLAEHATLCSDSSSNLTER